MDTHMKSCYTEVCEVALRNSSEKGRNFQKMLCKTNHSEQQQESTATSGAAR